MSNARPGSFCRAGETGTTANGTSMLCTAPAGGGRARWPKDPASRRSTGRRRATLPAVEAITLPIEHPVPPISGALTDEAPKVNGWGYSETEPLHYHDEGPIGTAIRGMGGDAQIDVDGHSLGNVLGVLATDVVLCKVTPQEGLDRMKALRDRLPAGRARQCLNMAIADVDAPMTDPPVLPAGTPAPLVDLVEQLNRIPMVRRDADNPDRELRRVAGLANDFTGGRVSRLGLIRQLRQLHRSRHESFGDVGTFAVVSAVSAATAALEAMRPHPAA